MGFPAPSAAPQAPAPPPELPATSVFFHAAHFPFLLTAPASQELELWKDKGKNSQGVGGGGECRGDSQVKSGRNLPSWRAGAALMKRRWGPHTPIRPLHRVVHRQGKV